MTGDSDRTGGLDRVTRLRYRLSNAVFRSLIWLALRIPYRWRVPLMGWIVSRVVAPLTGLRRRIRANLAYVLPDLPRAEVERIVRAVPDNAGRTLIEIYSGAEFAARAETWTVTGPGLAALDAAQAAGTPVFCVGAHLGNYDAARAALLARGLDMGALYRAMANPWFNAHYVAAIEGIGTPMFEQGRRGMAEMVRHIRAGKALGILIDLHARGMEATFFGKPARTSTATAEMALKYGAQVFPVYGLRQANGLDFDVVVQEPIPPGTPEEMTQALNDDLEAVVRQNMGQWYWIHRRWKVGPDAPRR